MTTKSLQSIIDTIIQTEGGYSNHADDKGGPTMYGITQAVARANGYNGPMSAMPRGLAVDIYTKRYITGPRFDLVYAISEPIGEELIDTGVNMGPATAAQFFQRTLNIFNLKGSRYADVFVDGQLGPVTLDTFKKFLEWRGQEGEAVFLKALNCYQGARYLELAERNGDQESFIYGWLKNRVDL